MLLHPIEQRLRQRIGGDGGQQRVVVNEEGSLECLKARDPNVTPRTDRH